MDDFHRHIQHDVRREQRLRQLLSTPQRILGLRGYVRLRRWLLGEV